MSTATLPRPLTPFLASTLPRCASDPDMWHDTALERQAIHDCRHHCPLAARLACERQAARVSPPSRCVQAGLVWITRPNRADRRRVVPGGTVPAARQPDEDLCPDCLAKAVRQRLCQACLDPIPADADISAVTCSLRCADRRSRAQARKRTEKARQNAAPSPAGTVPSADEGEA